MLRSQAILTVAVLFAVGCSAACAGDFMPRAGNGIAVVADDHATRPAASADAGPTAVMSEPVAAPTPRAAPAVMVSPRRAAHVGADDTAADAHAPAVADDDKGGSSSGPAHKSRAALRWQSLLPGVMK